MNQTFIKSTIILSVATLISKILGSIFRIPLQNIAGDEVLGIFSLVYPIYMTALILSVAGIPIAISKLISEARAKQNEVDIRNIFVTAGIIGALFGLISFLLLFIFSAPIARILGGSSSQLALIIVSVTLLIAPYMAVYRGYFQGFNDMGPTAYSQVLEQFIRVAIILIAASYLVNHHYSNDIISGGVMVGSSVGALFSLIYLRLKFVRSSVRPKSKNPFTFNDFSKTGKRILKISLPICVGAIAMALINLVDSLTIPFGLKMHGGNEISINYLYGIYGRGLALVQIATVFSTSLVLPLIPLLSNMYVKKQMTDVKRIVERAFRFNSLVSWPAAFGLLALTLPLNLALFTDLKGNWVLAIIGFSAFPTALSVLGTGILQGMDRERRAALIVAIGAILKVVANFIFINFFGIIGAAISTLFVYLVLSFINIYVIRQNVTFSVWRRENTVIIFASLVMGAVIGLPTLLLNVAAWGRLMALIYVLAALVIGVMIYLALILLLKGVDKQDLMSLPIVGNYFKKRAKNEMGN
jgi:O-antigen/teichoic acid export membrane protein